MIKKKKMSIFLVAIVGLIFLAAQLASIAASSSNSNVKLYKDASIGGHPPRCWHFTTFYESSQKTVSYCSAYRGKAWTGQYAAGPYISSNPGLYVFTLECDFHGKIYSSTRYSQVFIFMEVRIIHPATGWLVMYDVPFEYSSKIFGTRYIDLSIKKLYWVELFWGYDQYIVAITFSTQIQPLDNYGWGYIDFYRYGRGVDFETVKIEVP